MKKIAKYLFAVLTLLVMIAFSVFMIDAKKIGKALDTYKGVSVHYNGVNYSKSQGKNFSADGYYYGQKWQCVEFVKRFYYDVYHHKMPNVYGNAKDYYDVSLESGQYNKERGMYQYINGGTTKPKPDDLLVFTELKYGHVAIITKVTENSIEVIQQNVYGKPRQEFPLIQENGHYTIGKTIKPTGWLSLTDE